MTLHGCQFAANGVAVAGDHPCQVTGTGNRFVGNGIDLAGDVDPNLRSHLREAAQLMVTYPGSGYESLQEAVDALVPGGRLLLAAPVAESGTVDKSLTVEPASPGRLRISGASFQEQYLPAFSVVGDGEVELRRLAMGGILCGPCGRLSFVDVVIDQFPLVLTGQATVMWQGGAGGLRLVRGAAARVKGVLLEQGVSLDDIAHAGLEECRVHPAADAQGAAVRLAGLARLDGQEVIIRGGVSVEDRAELVFRAAHLYGPVADRFPSVLSVGSFANVELHEVVIQGGQTGIMVSPWGRPELTLDDVKICASEVALAADIRCAESSRSYGLWPPPLALGVTLGPGGVELISCRVELCPPCPDAVWPIGLCHILGLIEPIGHR